MPFLFTLLSQDHVTAFLCVAVSSFQIAKDEYLFYRWGNGGRRTRGDLSEVPHLQSGTAKNLSLRPLSSASRCFSLETSVSHDERAGRRDGMDKPRRIAQFRSQETSTQESSCWERTSGDWTLPFGKTKPPAPWTSIHGSEQEVGLTWGQRCLQLIQQGSEPCFKCAFDCESISTDFNFNDSYSTGNYILYPVINHNGKEYEKE